ncbi:MAG: hypothetical protein V3V25_09065 [Paracoccaceae bacterium]
MISEKKIERQSVVLAVGDVFQWRQAGQNLPSSSRIEFADIWEISTEFLNKLRPDIVLTCLVNQSFDFLDLAQVLESAEYKGSYQIIVPYLPNPKIVIAEAKTMCPSLDYCFVVDPTLPGGYVN